MRFFFPDAQDYVDPGFDFARESYSPGRVRQRDDRYAHELLEPVPYDGLLVSKAIVDSRVADREQKYTDAQRRRLLCVGAREFFRLPDGVASMGDCGAFSYVKEKEPPVTVDEVIDFYEACGFDRGVSVDHVILGFDAALDHALPGLDAVPQDWRDRQRLTLELAERFLRRVNERGAAFEPLGVAQGWSPRSYASCVERLQEIGYTSVALGGMVALKRAELLAALEAVSRVRRSDVQLHLLGVTKCDLSPKFREYGVTSFDSTSPFKQAFMDDDDNYYAAEGHYTAVRVPQSGKNPRMKKRILAGLVRQEEAARLERLCLDGLGRLGRGEGDLDDALESLDDNGGLFDDKGGRVEAYRATLAKWSFNGKSR